MRGEGRHRDFEFPVPRHCFGQGCITHTRQALGHLSRVHPGGLEQFHEPVGWHVDGRDRAIGSRLVDEVAESFRQATAQLAVLRAFRQSIEDRPDLICPLLLDPHLGKAPAAQSADNDRADDTRRRASGHRLVNSALFPVLIWIIGHLGQQVVQQVLSDFLRRFHCRGNADVGNTAQQPVLDGGRNAVEDHVQTILLGQPGDDTASQD